MFTIYKITNRLNGKFYIGFTKNPLQKRLREHFHHSRRKTEVQHLHNAIRKYGVENFSSEVLEVGENENYGLNVAESMYIKWLKPEYNKTSGGEGTLGIHFTEEHKKRLSAARIGKTPWNKGLRGMQVGPNRGKKASEKTRQLQRNAKLGKAPWNKGLKKTHK